MKSISVKYRITLGLVCLLASTILVTVFTGLGPDARQATMNGRAALCESIAINASVLIGRADIQRMEAILKTLVARNEDILSAGIRRPDGTLHLEIGEHVAHWDANTKYSTETHVHVPLRSQKGLWGTVELRFRPLRQAGVWAALKSPWTTHIAVVSGISFVLFSFYLGKILKQLDPSKAIPKRVRTALDTLAEGLLITDKKGHVVLANEAFSKWTGKPADELIGKDASSFPWMKMANAEDDQAFPWDQALEESRPQPNVLLELVDKDDRVRNLVANSSPVLGQDGQYRGVLTSFEDITELERHKVELSNARDAADAASQAKSDFLARMSHEIRTPMNAILGYTEILQRGMTNSQQQRQEFLHIIQSSGEHLLTLINDILDLSKIESGRMELELARYSPGELISLAVAIFEMKAQEKGIDLSLEFATKMPETILTDAVRMRQIIINLVGNAIKFTAQGGVRIVVRMTEPPNSRLAIDIVDTGIGISPEGLQQIFDPFAQADTSITRRFGGTGLGLSICKFLAERMGGEVKASSKPGVGSTFSVTIDPGPLDGVKMVTVDGRVRDFQLAESPATIQKLAPARILVVDDGEANRKLVSLFLTRAGATVATADNGQTAIDMVKASHFDVVLMDLHMPIMDGLTATRRLRAEGFTVPIVALTGNVMRDDRQTCAAAGCDGFLPKPIRMDSLLDTVSTILSDRVANQRCFSEVESEMETRMPLLANETAVVEVHDTKLDHAESVLNELQATMAELRDHRPAATPIYSSLPTDDPELFEIVSEFLVRLRSQTKAMEEAFRTEQFAELEELAHWLKGAGGSLGFDCFTIPARSLESSAKSADSVGMECHLKAIIALVQRIQMPSEPAVATSAS